jgi:hypothetical protein
MIPLNVYRPALLTPAEFGALEGSLPEPHGNLLTLSRGRLDTGEIFVAILGPVAPVGTIVPSWHRGRSGMHRTSQS